MATTPRIDLVKLIPRPQAFSGSLSDDVVTWVLKMELYFRCLSITDDAIKLNIGTMNLQDRAIKWLTGLVVLDKVPKTWQQFTTDIQNMFRNANATRIARDKLDDLRQTGSVSLYNEKFLNLLIDIGDEMEQKERLHRYTKGLKQKQQIQVVTSEVKTLQEAMEVAGKIDNVLWSVNYSQRNSDKQFTAMEIDSIKHTPDAKSKPRPKLQISREIYLQRRKDGLCLQCGKAGHRIAQCSNFQ